MNELTAKLVRLTPPQVIVAALIALGVYYMFFYDSGNTQIAQIARIQGQIQGKQKELQKLQQQAQEVSQLMAKREELDRQLDSLKKYVPQDLTASNLMGLISNEAKAAGANILNIQGNSRSSGKSKNNFLMEMPVQVQLKGAFSQLMLFMSYLTRVDKVITLNSFSMRSDNSPPGETPTIAFQGEFAGYRLNVEEDKGQSR